MEIHGFQKTTLLDYPGHLACTIFLGRCNFRCPFCHNSMLVINPENVKTIAEENALNTLKKRQKILEGVCITGGEPSLNPELEDFIIKVKNLGFKVKLDSNGYKPMVLERMLSQKLVDYIAMDIKAGRSNYGRVCGVERLDIGRIEESKNLICESAPDYEFRTTYVKGLHTEEDVLDIGQWLAGDAKYYIQNYKDGETVISPVYENFTANELEAFKGLLSKTMTNVHIRGDYE